MFATALLMCCGMAFSAQQGPSVTVNGEVLEKQVVSLTFSGNNVVLHFIDGSELSADMQELVLLFEKGTSTAIEVLKTPVTDRFLLEGLPVGTPVTIYDAQGKIVMTTKTPAASLLNVQSLRSGIYLLKADGHFVKFIKR